MTRFAPWFDATPRCSAWSQLRSVGGLCYCEHHISIPARAVPRSQRVLERRHKAVRVLETTGSGSDGGSFRVKRVF
jgi:hypothetical protein